MVERGQKRTAFVLLADTVQAHGIEALEDIVALAMAGGAAMRLGGPLRPRSE